MKVAALTLVWIVGVGAQAEAGDTGMIQGAQPGADRPRVAVPEVFLPQVPTPSLPPAPLASGLLAPVLRAPEPRPTVQGHRFEPPRGRTCFSQAETRENIATHRLSEPMKALHVGRQQGEALRARLCRWKPDEYVYEVSVLRRDGRIVHIYMNARNGQTVGALNDSERK